MNSLNGKGCTETKILLTGSIQRYKCELLYLKNTFGILRYIVDKEYTIADMQLIPGDVTTALYWTDRPYTLYIWQKSASTKDVAYYFNIADSISLLPDEFSWRDLIVDIFIDTDGMVHVLDENELPPNLPPTLQCYILAAKSHILRGYREIIAEANFLIKKYVVGASIEI